jgi:hypothetical protein
MKSAHHLAAASILLASLAGCAGLETGNGADALVRVEFALTAAQPVDSSGATFPLATAQANLRRVDLYLPAGASCRDIPGLADGRVIDDSTPHLAICSADGDHIRLTGPWVVDLVDGAVTPELPTLAVPPGLYRRVDVRFSPGDPDEGVVASGSPLDDVTIAATGQAPAGTNASFYSMRLRFEEEARFESVGFNVGAGSVKEVIALLDPGAWFSNLPLAECAASGDLPNDNGVLQIADGDDDCDDIEDSVRDAIRASGSLSSDD